MNTIDVEAKAERQERAVAVRDPEAGAVGRAMNLDELHESLEFIRSVMKREMKEGSDYGKIPGCGDKPGLFQPGAQKLLMAFRLSDHVKSEVVKDIPGAVAGHREYSFIVTVRAQSGREWDGVGTCSTLEGKYRWRAAERKCPECGKNTIIVGKAEYGGGFVCFKKKGGCGAKFLANDPNITKQASTRTEHDNPADFWNTVRKMAFKRALVHAAINATNTSELWSQDLEDLPRDGGEVEPPPPPQAPASKPAAPTKPKEAKPRYPTAATREWMIGELAQCRDLALEYFVKIGQLIPTEGLADLPLRFVPVTREQMKMIQQRIAEFGNGEQAGAAFPPNPEEPGEKPIEVPRDTTPSKADVPDEPWVGVIVPIPHKGQTRDEYLKNPETIGMLYANRHDPEVARRLWGFVQHYEPKGWTTREGKAMPASAGDLKFREALDQFAEWHDKHQEKGVEEWNEEGKMPT